LSLNLDSHLISFILRFCHREILGNEFRLGFPTLALCQFDAFFFPWNSAVLSQKKAFVSVCTSMISKSAAKSVGRHALRPTVAHAAGPADKTRYSQWSNDSSRERRVSAAI